MKRVELVGVSYRTASVDVRGSLTYTPGEAAELLAAVRRVEPDLEAAVLSTCNRTEFYLAGAPGDDFVGRWLHQVRRMRPFAGILDKECHRYHHSEASAVSHLLRVACGLDSGVLGDSQILGQVKEAMLTSRQSRSCGSTLGDLFTRAIRVGKRARSATEIGFGSASIGSVVASLLEDHLQREDQTVLVIGAGQLARDAARHIAKRCKVQFRFINRTFAGAQAMAALCGGTALPWSELAAQVSQVDAIIAATSARQPVLSLDLLQKADPARVVIVDAGSPRNVQADSRLRITDIDSLRDRQSQSLTRRLAAVPEVQRLVRQEVRSWIRWRRSRPVETTLKHLFLNAAKAADHATTQIVEQTRVDPAVARAIISRFIGPLLHGHARDVRDLLRQGGTLGRVGN